MGARNKAIWGLRLESRAATCSRWLKVTAIEEFRKRVWVDISSVKTTLGENEGPLLTFQSVYMKGPGPTALTHWSEVIEQIQNHLHMPVSVILCRRCLNVSSF